MLLTDLYCSVNIKGLQIQAPCSKMEVPQIYIQVGKSNVRLTIGSDSYC